MKKTFDFLCAFFGLILASPFLILLSAAIKATSAGPVVFAQQRVGRHQSAFTLYKLRTMYSGTDHLPTHLVSESRVTPLGGFLRRWKLDELPQLFNVLLGQMSLVGPRPCLPTQRELIQARQLSGAFEVLPGITGPAQIEGVDMSNPQRLAEIDGHYARTRSFIGDIALIFLTVSGRGLRLDSVSGETANDGKPRQGP
jgi:O-antigen biosynthesis protein WbqP